MNLKDIKIKAVSNEDFKNGNKTWPLTVDKGFVAVRGRDNAIIFIDSSNGDNYAINGNARMIGLKNITPIWNKKSYGRADLSDLINVGLKLLKLKEL